MIPRGVWCWRGSLKIMYTCIHAFSMAQFMSAFTNFESSYCNRLAKCGRDITEEENVGYPQSIEIIDKASIRNTFGIL